MIPHGKIPSSSPIEAELLIAAYSNGYFPMAESRGGHIRWYSPDPRAIIPLDGLIVSRSLRQTLKKCPFTVRIDSAFEGIIRSCADREDTWISEEIIQSYIGLHRAGFAHSVECWEGRNLAGGLYGVALGAAFFGESMVSVKRDASKIALVYLVDRLRSRNFELLDTQFLTPHLARLGAVEIPRKKYIHMLKDAAGKLRSFTE